MSTNDNLNLDDFDFEKYYDLFTNKETVDYLMLRQRLWADGFNADDSIKIINILKDAHDAHKS